MGAVQVPVPPQVTISGVSGNIVQYNALNSPTNERTSRPWRSNSLTPPSSDVLTPNMSSDWTGSFPHNYPKGRSHSLTFERGAADCLSESTMNISPAASSASLLDEKEIEEMIKSLPDGSGMRELREWLKSLRLHKYTKILLEVNYEELLTLTDETLEKKNVTMGARGKILKYIGHIKERPQTLKYVSKALTVGSTI